MGGRGASSGGRSGRAPRGYRTVGKIRGIPVIRNIIKKSGLPTRAPANSVYLGASSFSARAKATNFGNEELLNAIKENNELYEILISNPSKNVKILSGYIKSIFPE